VTTQLTQWGARQLAGITFGIIAPPTDFWIALANVQPSARGDGSMLANLEPPITAASLTYARQSIPADSSGFDLSDAGYVSNHSTVDFGIPDTNWGYTPYFAVCDAATDGDVYGFGEFANPQSLTNQFWVRLPAGAITFRYFDQQPSIVS
jgi:hypothetical protein